MAGPRTLWKGFLSAVDETPTEAGGSAVWDAAEKLFVDAGIDSFAEAEGVLEKT